MKLPIKRHLIAEVFVILGLSGCVAPRPDSTGPADHRAAPPATATAPGTAAAPAPAAATASAPSASAGKPVIAGGSAAAAPSADAAAPAASTGAPAPVNAAPSGKAPPPETAASAAAAAPPGRPARSPKAASVARAAPPAAASPAAPKSLNLAELEQRLRDTHAIGVFTKLSLKNQVDDLLGAFRDLYRDPKQRPSAELRQRYDLLLLKVLSLLQEGDPPLAAAIASSREAIWSILSDPDKFAEI